MRDQPSFLDHTPPKRLKMILIIVACCALVIAVFGIASRVIARQELSRWTETAAVPTVSVISLADAGKTRPLVLPGDIEAFYSAPVHARATGYLKRWYTDIGASVHAGQTLADIETPDLDQQLQQAKGNLGTALANQKLAEIEARRYRALQAQNAIAAELVDEKVGTLAADVAATEAARANVKQFEAEESFKHITAPFDGIVTSRSTDVGALITIGTTSDVPLFTVADEHRLRIYVHVPQNSAASIAPGVTATFDVPQFPGRVFTATLATTAQAIDATSGTLLAEFQCDNADGALKPGEYAQMHLVLPSRQKTLLVPATALVFRDGGMSVAVVDAQNRVAMKRIMVGRDLGADVEVSDGLTHADRVIDTPPDSLRPGDVVHVAGKAAGRRGGE